MGFKAVRVARGQRLLKEDLLHLPEGMKILPEDTREYARQIEALPEDIRTQLLPRTLMTALHRFGATRSIQDVSVAARGVCEVERDRLDSELGMVRFVAWAIPAIGFVGTVRGIGQALQQAHKAVEGDVSGVVVNCNLQRLDGPVRGNGKIIQELEAIFRGAGWNVIKVIWGAGWDELLARDVDGVLVNKMNSTVDGEFQKYAVESGDYIREHFFGPDPRLRRLVEHLSDDELRTLPRGGHDYRKVYAAYKMAVEHEGSPTVILAKTIKGWTLGTTIESRNATHQIKKLTAGELKVFRDRLQLPIPDAELEDGDPPYWHPGLDSPEYEYMTARRRALDGPVPERIVRKKKLTLPGDNAYADVLAGTGEKVQASTTTAFARLLRNLLRDPGIGTRVVPIIPDEARTFGLDALFRDYKIYAPFGQMYEPVDAELLLSYQEASNGRILEEGITEAGSMASFTAAGTAYATWGQPMIPFFIFYSMFGFQRVGDLIWSFGDQRGSRVPARRHRRPHHARR